MSQHDRIYFAQRAAEEQELADAADGDAAEAHRRLQRAYLERASVGERADDAPDVVGKA